MSRRSALLAALAVLVIGGAAHAGSLNPIEAHRVDLGTLSGVAYYTEEADGYRVVVTLAGDSGTPVRFIATLAPGQSVTVSAPRGAGEPAVEVRFVRQGEQLVVAEGARDRTIATANRF